MTPAPEKAAPIPAEDAARILIAALREYGQEDNRAGEAENMGRHAAVRGMMVRLGLYPEFCKALDADATEDEVAALLADQASQEERIREDEARLDWLEANSNVHVQYEGWEEDVWEVYRVNGGRSDREWSKIAESSSLRDAIDLARLRGDAS